MLRLRNPSVASFHRTMREPIVSFRLCLTSLICGLLMASTATADSKQKIRLVSDGERLVHILDCGVCHTPKRMTPEGPMPDVDRLFMGHPTDESPALDAPKVPAGWAGMFNANFTAWTGPWGVSYATNLTPDADTGIGSWSLDMFKRALRTGKHMGEGRPILPPMPWPAYARLSDAELEAVFAYLKSIPAVHNAVPDPVPAAAAQ